MAPAARSWIVLGQDGRHVSLGRTTPTDAAITAASDALNAQGLGGWIVTMVGAYWGRGGVALAPVQAIGADVTLDWPAAVAAFLDARQRARRAR
jgi:hypothetical protein